MESAKMATNRFRRRSLIRYPSNMGVVVVFCSFIALSLGPGLLNAYGVYEEEYDRLFDDKDDDLNNSALGSPVIFIGVTQILLANGMGFIGGRSAQRFGPGPTVFVGGILMSLGLFTASYARQVWQLCLTQGAIFGLGVMLVWIPAASAPSSWFGKNRGLATGVTHMGLGIGGLVFAPLTRFLLERVGTSGSLRWLSLVMLVGVTVASLGIHSKKHERVSDVIVSSVRWSKCLDEEISVMPEGGYDSDQGVDFEEYRRSSWVEARRKSGTYKDYNEEADIEFYEEGEMASMADDEVTPDIELVERGWAPQSKTASTNDCFLLTGEEDLEDEYGDDECSKVSDRWDKCGSGGVTSASDIKQIDAIPGAPAATTGQASQPLREPKRVHFASDALKLETLEKLEGLNRQEIPIAAREQMEKKPREKRRAQISARKRGHMKQTEMSTPSGPKSVLRSWRFWLLSLGVGIGQAGWYIVLLFMTSIAVSVGMDVHNAAIILGFTNGASAVGQFAAGYAADMIGPVNALMACMLVATLSNAILFIPNLTFHLLIVYACFCGAAIGATDPLTVIAGVTQFGRARVASTTGFIYGSVGAFVILLAPNARVMLQRLGMGTDYLPVYAFIISLFSLSTVFLLAMRMRISRKLWMRA
ncbi:MFS general substrate transporter [Martensiomyces pterosporus]|nr:MFS general substrate transporter [Martensiomyces pterosporus]